MCWEEIWRRQKDESHQLSSTGVPTVRREGKHNNVSRPSGSRNALQEMKNARATVLPDVLLGCPLLSWRHRNAF